MPPYFNFHREINDAAFGYYKSRASEALKSGLRLAHYTSAENALKILTTKSLWLRSAVVMNDFSEIEHGQECLQAALRTAHLTRLRTVLDNAHPGLFDNIFVDEYSNIFWPKNSTYLVSLCSHSQENEMGLLSMWRAYGGPVAGVALVLNANGAFRMNHKVDLMASPVLYGGPDEFIKEFENFVERLENISDYIKNVEVGWVRHSVVAALRSSVLSTKHEAFKEEQEWRIILTEKTKQVEWPPEIAHLFRDQVLDSDVECVRGIPQLVYKLPLDDTKEPAYLMPELALPRLIHKILIGPCLYPEQIRDAFVAKLTELKVPSPDERVIVTNIPLRQWG